MINQVVTFFNKHKKELNLEKKITKDVLRKMMMMMIYVIIQKR